MNRITLPISLRNSDHSERIVLRWPSCPSLRPPIQMHQEKSNFLNPIKDFLALKKLGAYSICCECGKIYTGQINHSAETKVKEQHRHMWLYHLVKSITTEHSTNMGHHIL
ncbi:hypothetical protein L798_00808 [Zootermopsis nevadensis]|uniref:GIY-YIG domain-containing protein n=1 Tax=Zootermopsis nevadensis TaxID=136037 RepID=A0A067QIE4_ZOONE|nr:hypothetical protein L798_00808 [Zootermopsis nevadensis]